MPLARVLGHAFDALVAHWRVRSEQVLALGLLLFLIVLVPLAHASPPDPVWIAGIYDDADFDDAVVAVVSATGLVEASALLTRPADIRAGTVSPYEALLGAAPATSTCGIRAPPT